MPETLNIPVLTRNEVLEANLEAVTQEYSAYCWHDTLRLVLQEGNKHPVTAASLDQDGNFVCRILVGLDEIVFIALTKARFNALGTVPVDLTVLEAMAEALESPIN